MKIFKCQIKNFTLTQSAPVTNQLKQKFNQLKKTHRQYISLKTNYIDDFIGLTNLIGNNFNIKNTSQVYNQQASSKYLGYLELESSLNEIVIKSQLESLVDQYGIDKESASFEIEQEIPDRNLFKNEKRFSFFNKKKVSTIVSANLYYKWSNDTDVSNNGPDRNQDYGVILDKLEENKENFDIIEIQAESDVGIVQHHFEEFIRIKHFMERIRDRAVLRDKLISVRTKKANIAVRAIQEGADIINDSSSGNADPILLDIVSKSKVPYILSTYAGQENLSNYLMANNFTKLTPFEYYLNTVERRLNLCLEKGIPSFNISIDLNLNQFGKNLSIDIYDRLNLIKNKFENTLMSSFNVDHVIKSIVGEKNNENDLVNANIQIIDYLVQNGINVIRFDYWNNFEKISRHIKNLKNIGEDLHTGIKERRQGEFENPKIEEGVEVIKKEEVELDSNNYDELTTLIKKLESGKI